MLARLLILGLFFSLAALRCQAQFGVQVGGAITAVKFTRNGTEADHGWNFRYNAGVLYRIRRLGGLKKIDLQPTLQYITKGSSDTDIPYRLPPNTVNEVYTRLHYVQASAPGLFRANEEGVKNITYNLGAGPYLASLVAARAVSVGEGGNKAPETPADMRIGNGTQDDIKRLDAGLTLYLSMKLGHVSSGVSYDYGLLNVSPRTNTSMYNRSFCIFFGYLLR